MIKNKIKLRGNWKYDWMRENSYECMSTKWIMNKKWFLNNTKESQTHAHINTYKQKNRVKKW